MKYIYWLMITVLNIIFFNYIVALDTPITVGVDYTIINNKSTIINKQSKLTEFFSFNCVHCQTMDAMLTEKHLPHIQIEKIQVAWSGNDVFLNFAKINATLSILKLNHGRDMFFNAVINDKIAINNVDNIKQILIKNHIKTELIKQFFIAFNSFEVDTMINQYKILTKQYNIIATPTFIVNDKYLLKPATPKRTIEVIQFLAKISTNKNA